MFLPFTPTPFLILWKLKVSGRGGGVTDNQWSALEEGLFRPLSSCRAQSKALTQILLLQFLPKALTGNNDGGLFTPTQMNPAWFKTEIKEVNAEMEEKDVRC